MMHRLALFGLLLLASTANAQSAVVDEGTFMITRDGAPVGRESFRIVRAPGPAGQAFKLTAQSAIGTRRVSTTLATDSAGVPVTYEAEVTDGGELVQRIQGRGRPGRFSVLVQTKSGESAREYLVTRGALLLDEQIFHHFFFLPLSPARTQLSVISPREAQQASGRMDYRGATTVEVAGRAVAARHFTLVGEGAAPEVWVDRDGRLLAVSLPQKGLKALRDELPR